jgi:hypothetical protein
LRASGVRSKLVAMARYTLFAKRAAPAAAEVAAIESNPEVLVIDRTGDRAFLIETNEAAALRLRAELNDWIVEPERVYPHPKNPSR